MVENPVTAALTDEQIREALADPEVQRQLRPAFLRLLSELGITPCVDEATGELMVPAGAFIAALGMSAEQAAELLHPDGLRAVPADRMKPLQ
jgi:hypothetical protein